MGKELCRIVYRENGLEKERGTVKRIWFTDKKGEKTDIPLYLYMFVDWDRNGLKLSSQLYLIDDGKQKTLEGSIDKQKIDGTVLYYSIIMGHIINNPNPIIKELHISFTDNNKVKYSMGDERTDQHLHPEPEVKKTHEPSKPQ